MLALGVSGLWAVHPFYPTMSPLTPLIVWVDVGAQSLLKIGYVQPKIRLEARELIVSILLGTR
jgi:hypothetical protein